MVVTKVEILDREVRVAVCFLVVEEEADTADGLEEEGVWLEPEPEPELLVDFVARGLLVRWREGGGGGEDEEDADEGSSSEDREGAEQESEVESGGDGGDGLAQAEVEVALRARFVEVNNSCDCCFGLFLPAVVLVGIVAREDED